MSFQSMLQQEDEQRYGWGGNGTHHGSHGSHRLKALASEEGGLFVQQQQQQQEVDGGNFLRSGSGGGGVVGGGYRGEAPGSLSLNTASYSGYGADLTLFSPSDLFSPSSRQIASSPFNWQSLLSNHNNSNARWHPDAAPAFSAPFGSDAEQAAAALSEYGKGKRGNGGDLCLAHESSASDGVISEVEGDVKEEWRSSLNPEESWRKFGDLMAGNVKQEEYENIQEAGRVYGDGNKPRKIPRSSGLAGAFANFEPSASSSQSDSDSEDSGRLKREILSRKRKKPGQDADGNVTWTDESVRFLFETYDAIHKRLWEESKGQVKYQKKWTPILKAMQAKFGDHFTKKQCQSKYWSVRRECTEYRITSAKAAATDPMWNPSIAGRELLKPKFYDVWLDVSGKNLTIVTKPTVKGKASPGDLLEGEPSRVLGKDGQPVKRRAKDSGPAMMEMQRLMLVELQASEKREEAMKYRAELMMELLTQHIAHVETRVTTIDESRNPQLHLLERVNQKLEKVLDGFAVLNQNLSLLH